MCTQPLFFCAHAADVSEDSGVECLAQGISNVTVSYRHQGKLFTLGQNPSMGSVDSDIGYNMGSMHSDIGPLEDPPSLTVRD